jgi:S-adenosylmethionine-dependent methyltransferase
MADQNFDELAERFERNLYGNPRGQIRLQLVTDALLEDCPSVIHSHRLRVLDAGCGIGQMTRLLASHGHHVVSADVSSVLLARARERITQENIAWLDNIRFIQSSVQQLDQHIEGTFDLVIFHAVLEWMENPCEGLQSLLPWLRPGGELSLMFYNQHSLVFKNLLRGNFEKVDKENFRGESGSLTPINPLLPEKVEQWLHDGGIEIYSRRGIRTFYEYMDQTMHPANKKTASVEDIIRLEKIFGREEPYRSLGRYQLWHCRKK